MGGETLHVLDVLVALAKTEPHVGGGHIVLQIDKSLAPAAHLPHRGDRRTVRVERQIPAQVCGADRATQLRRDRARCVLAVTRGGRESGYAPRRARYPPDGGGKIGGKGCDRLLPREPRAE